MQQGLVDDDCLFALVSEPVQGSEFDLLSGQGLGDRMRITGSYGRERMNRSLCSHPSAPRQGNSAAAGHANGNRGDTASIGRGIASKPARAPPVCAFMRRAP
jgi:hypothetical protein